MFKTSIRIFCIFFFLITSIFTYGCQNKKTATEKYIELTDPQTQKIKSVKTLFYNIPSPIEVTGLIKKMNLSYQPDLMNSVNNADNYLSQADIAINIGIYGADLSYIRIYDQFQDAARYLSIIKKFTRELGIPEEQEKITARRMEQNIENQDSLLSIITDTFTKSDSYLKENKRGGVAALIVFGGWVETLYLATNIVDMDHPQKDMISLITQQKHSVKNLIGLLNQYRDNYKIKQILPELKKLDGKFQEIEQSRSPGTKAKTKDGKTVIKNKVILTASNETLIGIREINNNIRETLTEL